MATRTYRGSCRCGTLRFEVDLDLAAGTSKCNCTYCWKARWWGARAAPDDFRLLSSGELSYGFGRESFVERGLCKACGITPFGWGHIPELGGNYVSINLACLDDLDPGELASAPVTYLDGRNDNWWNVPAETRHL